MLSREARAGVASRIPACRLLLYLPCVHSPLRICASVLAMAWGTPMAEPAGSCSRVQAVVHQGHDAG